MQPLSLSPEPFVPNVRFSRKVGRESAFLLFSLVALIVSACTCAIVTHHRSEMSADFVRHARIALLETTLDRFTWSKPDSRVPYVTSSQLQASLTHTNAFTAAGHLPSPALGALSSPPSSPVRSVPAGSIATGALATARTASASSPAIASSAPSNVAVTPQPNSQRSHRPWMKSGAAAADASSSAMPGAASGVAAMAEATPLQRALQPATSSSANSPGTAPNSAAAKVVSGGKAVEAVSRSKAMISTIDHDGVTLSNGHKIAVGTLFSTGERLLSVDPGNDQFTTDKRTIVLF
jgi:hypothetical protein